MFSKATALFVAVSAVLLSSCAAVDPVLSVHGSGTTNPQKCYWHVMDKIESRAKLPLHLTYRGIGSSSGQKEFIADPSITDFGSGDIPLALDRYNNMTQRGIEVLQLPVFVGAVSVFHSVPSAPTLNMTGCVLAKIFKRQITTWDDKEILDLNPDLLIPRSGFPINVAHRVDGSSSTAGITNYLSNACPTVWSADNAGSTVDWPADTMDCEGSGGMVDCINSAEGSIGYLDSGHGRLAGFDEVVLENKAGTKLTSAMAMQRGGVAAAAEVPGLLPASADLDFSEVSLINQEGQYTWPISAITYIYVKKDLTGMEPQSQALLVAFLKALYDPSFVQQCVDAYEFSLVAGSAKGVAENGINSIITSAAAIPFTFEGDTDLYAGQGEYVISAKRGSAVEVEAEANNVEISQLKLRIAALEEQLKQAIVAVATVETQLSEAGLSAAMPDMDMPDANDSQVTAALAMGAVSMVLWGLFLLFVAFRAVSGGSAGASSSHANGGV